MRESSEVRRQRILAVTASRGTVRVSDLAGELDVSIVTIRRDVEELARLGKLRRGHGVARSLTPVEQPEPRQATNGAIALVVPERHTYLYETMNGARKTLEEAGMRVVLHIAPQARGAERPIVEKALTEPVQGLLMAPRWRTSEEEAEDDWLADTGVPTVLMERRPSGGLRAMNSVCSDHWYGMHLAVKHLTDLGHRRIVLAARDDSPTARVLRRAFREISADLEDAVTVRSSPDTGLVDVLRERRATAAVLHGDEDALMLVQQMMHAGMEVPRMCSVVSYDDVVASLGSIPLTAVAPPKTEVGRVAAELLLRKLKGEVTAPERIELLPTLKIRSSTERLNVS
ncbi:DNA-binding transcriptional regulator, LacI/PurR family [Lentzea albidocapillata subsp. violacea]|uniref:DNA-binding transcriptional regulator, LacI/PurR family n=1 Tax=Lentzea albidocapillata subsp. violacea TaxID=128104 RepID=A0A1G9QQV3_9PSEU|nr:substrate-binding domain-containing protein [Lentzea albidocapillata]SDM12655.1 DNA-binding transcriptional regulator, LacI/PurR family [Lentzea albidocapillata subsp. violacea]